ncbi:iron complex transport system substrate-binding protein [Catenuloplanes nepalensis]|uniref:Iron complex transport system substrate-binding protein n=1 Tax=Catenuloplanes nepalensis TaxID=587533 RepID=A0ABT9MU77_9ACTN|nr:ABC transporter substrate-binding protein [Catenuloplanes nepalensis]MDP9795005.1 iron complex transport system substrate-binding protein [Catenuloplanes nepalensis]
MINRRLFLTTGVGLAGGALLAACGSSSEEPAATPSATEREVQTDKGPVKVPASPAKVVCADYYGAFAVVDLGLIPVGVGGGGYEGTGAFYGDRLKAVPVTGDYTEPDVEKIAAAGPDLILRTIDTPDALYQQLSAIAPTVVISFQQLSLLDVANRLGDVLGRTTEAQALLTQYEQKTAAVKTKHAATLAEHTFSFVQVATETAFWTLGPAWTDTTVLIACGVQLAEPSKSQTEQTQEYSFEQIDILEPSGALLIPAGPDGVTASPDNAAMTDLDLWKNLSAVKAGRVYPIVSGASSLGTGIQLADRMDTVLTELAGS